MSMNTSSNTRAYTVYGWTNCDLPEVLLGFNGEYLDPLTHHYPLGKGHRAFSPRLMRFYSPDVLSPFDNGGLNAYAYCAGDPANLVDPTGLAPTTYRFPGIHSVTSRKPTALTAKITAGQRRPAPGLAERRPPDYTWATAKKLQQDETIPPYSKTPKENQRTLNLNLGHHDTTTPLREAEAKELRLKLTQQAMVADEAQAAGPRGNDYAEFGETLVAVEAVINSVDLGRVAINHRLYNTASQLRSIRR
ncbi:hypothetical protein D3C76_885900 [compost metagenome]|jgi:RHS repeat-associated protein|uniref:RHS repeat-associated core domain-containing protein n=1 Tax=Pseudomonas TaxID=286 RepID=UPI00097C3F07